PTTSSWPPDATTSSGSTMPALPTAGQTPFTAIWSTSANAVAVLSDRLCHPSRPNVAETRGPRTGVDRAVLVTGFVLVGVDHWGATAGIPRGAPSCPRPGYRCVTDVLARGVLAD